MIEGVTAGTAIRDRDGALLGRVKEVRGNFLKVSARWQPDYWLHSRHVQIHDDGRVTTLFSRRELHRRRLDAPADTQYDHVGGSSARPGP